MNHPCRMQKREAVGGDENAERLQFNPAAAGKDLAIGFPDGVTADGPASSGGQYCTRFVKACQAIEVSAIEAVDKERVELLRLVSGHRRPSRRRKHLRRSA